MASDSMSVRLHLRGIRVLEVVTDEPGQLVVAVMGTGLRSRCPFCGFLTAKVHETRTVRVRDLPVSGRPTTLLWRRRALPL